MPWDKRVEDMIWEIFRFFDLRSKVEQQAQLKSACLSELNRHPALKEELKTDRQLQFFIIQMALESLSIN